MGGKGRGEPDENSKEFRDTLREVLDFVTPQLGKQARRHYEEAKIRALGGTLEKREKKPYRLLQEDAKHREEKRKKILAEEKLLGVTMSTTAHRIGGEEDRAIRKRKEALKEKKKRQRDGLLRIGLGAREHKGMATIPS